MKISIIIPTWNTAQITLRCVDSILKNLPKDIFEIIIVDNHSTDDTVKMFSRLKNVVNLIKNPDNYGYAKACNQGAKIATGNYLLFLNSDMRLTDSKLLNMAKHLASNLNIGVIGPKLLNPDLSVQASIFPPQTITNAIKEYWFNQKSSYSKYLVAESKPISVNAISGGAMLIEKEFFKSIGGWNEKYHFYYEDMDLCRRIIDLHKDIVYYPNCTFIHDHGASGTKIASSDNQWRRLIPGSILYHGKLKHYIISFVLWSGQKLKHLL
jgi:GT2 family glycosyltransferase